MVPSGHSTLRKMRIRRYGPYRRYVVEEILAHPFKPIIFKDTEVLILGSFPSIRSFENNFYYAHPRNQFWKILEGGDKLSCKTIKDQKIWLLKESKFGLWDMIQNCSRDNSLDSSLEEEVVNDIASFLRREPKLSKSWHLQEKKSQASV